MSVKFDKKLLMNADDAYKKKNVIDTQQFLIV